MWTHLFPFSSLPFSFHPFCSFFSILFPLLFLLPSLLLLPLLLSSFSPSPCPLKVAWCLYYHSAKVIHFINQITLLRLGKSILGMSIIIFPVLILRLDYNYIIFLLLSLPPDPRMDPS